MDKGKRGKGKGAPAPHGVTVTLCIPLTNVNEPCCNHIHYASLFLYNHKMFQSLSVMPS